MQMVQSSVLWLDCYQLMEIMWRLYLSIIVSIELFVCVFVWTCMVRYAFNLIEFSYVGEDIVILFDSILLLAMADYFLQIFFFPLDGELRRLYHNT